MSSTKFTPGPVETLARLGLQSTLYDSDPDFRDAVDAVLGNPRFDAAEEMYAALSAVDHECRNHNHDGDVVVPSHVWDLISTALEKARGE